MIEIDKKNYNKSTVFEKIISREIVSDIVYQDEWITAFKDISPKAPVHILIVTNICIPTVNEVSEKHINMLGRLFIIAAKVAERMKINETGYRLIVNCNRHGRQEIHHLHMHLLGGRDLGPMIL